MLKKGIIFMLAMAMMLSMGSFSYADDSNGFSNTENNNGEEYCSEEVLDDNGSQSEDVENAGDDATINHAPSTVVTSELIDQYTTKNAVFAGYNSMTKDWSYASEYVLKKGKGYTFSGTVSSKWGNVGISWTYKSSVDIHIPANPQKASRLAVKSKITYKKYRYKKWVNGTVVKTWTGTTAKAVGSKTNYAKYK